MVARTSVMSATLLRLGAGALGLTAVGVFLVQGSEAAFTASTTEAGSSIAAGTVALSDSNSSSSAMFNVGNLNGGQVITRCVNVDYSGTLTADIRLHGVTSGELAPGLATQIELGTGAAGGSSFSCDGFQVPQAPSFNDTLAVFGTTHKDYATGIGGYDDATAGATKSYRITMTVSNDNTFQGKTAGVAFTWEAQGEDVSTANPTTPAPQ